MNDMSEWEIKRLLREKNLYNLYYEVIYKNSTESTNDDAKKSDNKNNLLVVAERQTAGRGRYGRSFHSESDKGIYFTIKINKINNSGYVNFIPLIAAAAVSQAVCLICGIDLIIKWPNDLLCKKGGGYGKVCGILTESNASYVIAGIGLNVNNDITDFPDALKKTASSLKIISGKTYSRAEIICEITDNFTRLLRVSREQLLGEYKKRLALDTDISFEQDGAIYKGRAAGITENGNLIAVLENGEKTVIQSGEIEFI